MAERTPAPGVVEVAPHGMLRGVCHHCPWRIKASDMDYVHTWLGRHLRTEHADLWRECGSCAAACSCGTCLAIAADRQKRCPDCHGRGYVETERSTT